MKVVLNKHRLPKRFGWMPKWGKLIAHEALLKINRHSRLRCKLLIFRTREDLDRWYSHVLKRPGIVCKGTQGIFGNLSEERDGVLYVDPYYFGIICLIKGFVTPEIVIHECIHAAFAYASRMKGRQWSRPTDLPEEEICYPAGSMSAMLLQYLANENLLEPTP